MALSLITDCSQRSIVLGLGLLFLGFAYPISAERYETITREDGSVEVRRVESTAASDDAGEEQGLQEADAGDDHAGPAAPSADAQDPAAKSGVSLEAEVREAEAEAAAGAEANGGRFEPDESYIDAAELEKSGFQRDGRQKFYTYIDESGQFHSRPYQDVGQTQKPEASLPDGQQILAEEQWLSGRPVPEGADAEASRILGLNQAQETRDIDRLANSCCAELLDYMRKLEYPVDELDGEDGIVLNIAADEADYGFGTGRSLFRVVSLDELERTRRVRLRSFVNANKSDLYYPAVLTLDKDWKPVRLFNDIVYSYEAESWFRRAYLEGFLELDPEREAYAVILSRQRDQSRKSVVYPDEYGPDVLNHVRHGTVQLSLVGVP
ncbi:MAG: hypothetical protein CME36_06550 [unclassified Hahellaceae]|nr:hypothetical protein [Hahellaceae bacterium]|tara:strand:+ start:22374 stop:23513 length:1140 start_codon:yes stop_codon:yes gene_type:complete